MPTTPDVIMNRSRARAPHGIAARRHPNRDLATWSPYTHRQLDLEKPPPGDSADHSIMMASDLGSVREASKVQSM
ncbi:hypothetical protein N7535_006407 [Penicillium sp. DV-2018c]|nr:hypothetical protein N7535_006407 [Penicillium sp. DV-2018c]